MLEHVIFQQFVFDHPVHFAIQQHRVFSQRIQHVPPFVDNICFHRIELARLHVFQRKLEIFFLNFQRAEFFAVIKLDFPGACKVIGNFFDRFDRIAQRKIFVDKPIFDHPQHKRRRPDFQIIAILRHVGIADNHMQPPVIFFVGVGFVAGIDDAAVVRGGAGNFLADVVGALRHRIIAAVPFFLNDFARAGINLARDKKRDQLFG